MVFLIEYARTAGRVIGIREFLDADRPEAENARLDLELQLNRDGVDHEIVLLEAASEDALRRTHGRYFEVADWPDTGIEWPDGDLPDQSGDIPDV